MKQNKINRLDIIVYEDGRVIKNNNLLKFHITNGYLRTRIENKNYYLHRLLAEAFLSTFNNKLSINHINGNKLDNRLENLECISLSANTKHAHVIGINNNKGENNRSSKLSKKEVLDIYNSTEKYIILSKKYNISISTISLIKNKKKWLCIHN